MRVGLLTVIVSLVATLLAAAPASRADERRAVPVPHVSPAADFGVKGNAFNALPTGLRRRLRGARAVPLRDGDCR